MALHVSTHAGPFLYHSVLNQILSQNKQAPHCDFSAGLCESNSSKLLPGTGGLHKVVYWR